MIHKRKNNAHFAAAKRLHLIEQILGYFKKFEWAHDNYQKLNVDQVAQKINHKKRSNK